MKCDYCDRKATVYFSQIVGETTKKQCLCDECAVERGVTDPGGFMLGEFNPQSSEDAQETSTPSEAPSFFMGQEDKEQGGEQPARPSGSGRPEGSCPTCGFAFDDLKKTGRLGCAGCYQFFREEVKANLSGMHKGLSHKGQVPEGMMEAFQRQQAIDTIRQDMDLAIAQEDYEKAAALRDELARISSAGSEPAV
ncbi:MAG: UvrB/UvrC motif-containing protein [Akkermansiaceae bacterium]